MILLYFCIKETPSITIGDRSKVIVADMIQYYIDDKNLNSDRDFSGEKEYPMAYLYV